jgi:hypothetical protein
MKKCFEVGKVKKEIERSGTTFLVFRRLKNKFGELSGKDEMIFSFQGLYHEKNGFVKVTYGESAITRTKKEPMILCLKPDVENLNLGDRIMFKEDVNKKVYLVSSITNIQEWDIIFDISLEEQVRNVAEN